MDRLVRSPRSRASQSLLFGAFPSSALLRLTLTHLILMIKPGQVNVFLLPEYSRMLIIMFTNRWRNTPRHRWQRLSQKRSHRWLHVRKRSLLSERLLLLEGRFCSTKNKNADDSSGLDTNCYQNKARSTVIGLAPYIVAYSEQPFYSGAAGTGATTSGASTPTATGSVAGDD